MEITFLGTSAMVPTKERNHSGIFITYSSEGLLFDCGEGIQRQMKAAGINPNKTTRVFISHWHGDHVLGLPGLIQTLAANEYSGTLRLYGPGGSREYLDNMLRGFSFDHRIDMEVLEFTEEKGIVCETSEFIVYHHYLDHSIPCMGFTFLEKDRRRINLEKIRALGIPDGPHLAKLQNNQAMEWKGKTVTPDEATILVPGRRLSYIADTRMCAGCIELARDADTLICEATHSAKIEEKADQYGHLTASQAAMIASQANVKRLILTHFSQRYKTTEDLESEARDIFPETICAYDFFKAKVEKK